MSEEDEIAAEAHRLLEDHSFTPRRLLSILNQGRYRDYATWRLVTSQRELLLPALRILAREREGIDRLNAARALLELGDPVGSEVIVACLKVKDFGMRVRALDRLSWFVLASHKRELTLPSDSDADAVLEGLESCIGDLDPQIRERAILLIYHLSTPRALDRLTHLLGAEDQLVRLEAAIALGLTGQDRGALAILDEQLEQPDHPKRYRLVSATENLCKSADAGVRARAAAALKQFVQKNLRSGDDIASSIQSSLDGIAAAQVDYEPDLLREVMASKVHKRTRSDALKRLAELSGKDSVALLLSALPDPELRETALKSLAALMLKGRDPQAMEVLANEMTRDQNQDISELVNAYLAAGGNSIELLDSVAARVDDDIALTIYWLRTGLTPRKAAECLRPAIVGRGPTEEKLNEIEATWRDKPDAKNVVFAILDRLGVILYKTVDAAADHAEVVTELAEITGDRFVVEDVVQTVESEDELRIRFIHNGVGHTFPLRHHGRYINGDDVLAGLNGVLERLDFAERFIHIDVGDVAAVVVFVRAEAFFAAAETLRIPLKTDREAARLPPLPV